MERRRESTTIAPQCAAYKRSIANRIENPPLRFGFLSYPSPLVLPVGTHSHQSREQSRAGPRRAEKDRRRGGEEREEQRRGGGEEREEQRKREERRRGERIAEKRD